MNNEMGTKQFQCDCVAGQYSNSCNQSESGN